MGGWTMDNERARTLLQEERRRVERLLMESRQAGSSDREAADEPGDIADPAERLTAEGLDDAIVTSLQARLDAITRAEKRLEAGTFGRSIRSDVPIVDDRLEADPAAELTATEAANEP
jgi:DnaK suppressor protein